MTIKDAYRIATIEQLIDKVGLAVVVETIATVCDAKADHIQANWQDDVLAKGWTRAARRFDTLAAHLNQFDVFKGVR